MLLLLKWASYTYVQSCPCIGDQSYRLALNYIIDLKIARYNNKKHFTSVLIILMINLIILIDAFCVSNVY